VANEAAAKLAIKQVIELFQTEPKVWLWIERIGSLVSLFGIPAAFIYLRKYVQRLGQRRRIEANIFPLNSGFTGLICCVSAPLKGTKEEAEQLEQLIDESEFFSDPVLSMRLRATRIGPILKAFEQHQRDVKHCWLIASHDSEPYFGPLLKACKKYFPNVTVHTPVEVNDVYAKIDEVYSATHSIFERCKDESNGDVIPKTLIADLTGGTKIMSIAVAMACLDVDRKMQYIEQKEQKTFYEIEITYEKVSTRPSTSA
jgi:hypothetical protein